MTKKTDPAGLGLRLIAAQRLRAVLGGEHFAPLSAAELPDGRDRSLANRLINTALRRQGQINLMIAELLEKGMPAKSGTFEAVLRLSLGGETGGPDREAGFDAGLDLGLEQPEKLAGLLFKVRAGALLSARSPAWCSGFLSGLLIGAEIGGQRDWLHDCEVPLIGSAGLCGLYAKALDRIGTRSRVIDATDATLAGLKAARAAS